MSYFRIQERAKRLKKTYDETKHSCCAGVYFDEDKKRFIRYYPSKQGYAKYLRKIGNRKFRRSKNTFAKGCGYKKCFDLWWELF